MGNQNNTPTGLSPRPDAAWRSVPEGRRGVAMATTVITVFATGAMVAMMLTLASASRKSAEVHSDDVLARYLAEGAIQIVKKDIQQTIANWGIPEPVQTVMVDGHAVQVSVGQTGYFSSETAPTGIQTWLLGYGLEAETDFGGAHAKVSQLINARATPIFQFAVFYTEDLEVSPGPNMTLGGRVHSNENIYLSPNGSTLTANTNYVRSVGDIYRARKNNLNASNGTVMIRKYVENPFDPTEPEEYVEMVSKGTIDWLGGTSVSGYDSNFTEGLDYDGDGTFYSSEYDLPPFLEGSLEFWSEPDGYTDDTGYSVLTGEHGIGEAVTPTIGSIKAYEEVEGGSYEWDTDLGDYVEVGPGAGTHDPGFFHETAGLKIIVTDDSGDWYATNSSGVDITADLKLVGAVSIEEIFDARQADGSSDTVMVAQVNVAALNTSGHFPSNGLLYQADLTAGPGTDCGGLMLTNASEVASGLTCVSESPIYVQGDFNTVNKKGCSVIADAVNLLSNDWDNSKTVGTLPTAADTTFNTAIITGNQETTSSNYNGGLENLPRFHENWSGKTATITGSLVNTWQSELATGFWKYGGDRYTAPGRNWNYDESFNDLFSLPPYTPMAVSADDVVIW